MRRFETLPRFCRPRRFDARADRGAWMRGVLMIAIMLLAGTNAHGATYYVTTTGLPLAPGTIDAPADLPTGLSLLHSGDTLRIASGAYTWTEATSGPLQLGSGERIEGAFVPDAAGWYKDWFGSTIITVQPALLETTIGGHTIGGYVGLNLTGVSQFGIKDLTLRVLPGGASGTTDNCGRSVYGVRLDGCSDYLFSRVTIVTGGATGGIAGVDASGDGISAGGNGTAGGGGSTTWTNCAAGGAGGTGHGVGAPSAPTSCGTGASNASGGSVWRAGGVGAPGGAGGGSGEGHGGPGGTGGSGYSGGAGGGGGARPSDNSDPCRGRDGGAGSDGTAGAAGASWPKDVIQAAQRDAYFIPYRGRDGGDGYGGGGGGGGAGGSGGHSNYCAPSTGGGGGGGGGGGDGGRGATAGYGGGSAYAVYLVANGPNGVFSRCALSAGAAGSGGKGGTGSAGGARGIGGSGGSGTENWLNPFVPSYSGDGGAGGAGGEGGKGGDGQSGTDGESVALRTQSGQAPTVTSLPGGPRITALADVPGDQGGVLTLGWQRNELDTSPSPGIDVYRIWRSAGTPALMAAAWEAASGSLADPPGWTVVAEVAATGLASYTRVVATLNVSTNGSKPYERFVVVASDRVTGDSYASAPDSAYSIDNLPPWRPNPISADYRPNGVWLHWGSTHEADLQNFRLYRAKTPVFTPSLMNLLVTLPGTVYSFTDFTGDATYYYEISAVDAHGNESPAACFTSLATPVQVSLVSSGAVPGEVRLEWQTTGEAGPGITLYRRTESVAWQALAALTPTATGSLAYTDRSVIGGQRYGYRLGVPENGVEVAAGEVWVNVPAAVLSLEGARPNPAPAATGTVSFTLASAMPATLEVLDVSGRAVSVREVGWLGPGPHQLRLGDGATLVPGVYLIRLTSGSSVLRKRAVVMR